MNFLACDREQTFLMPPDLRDWLPEDHLAWWVLASVEEMDLAAFYGSYSQDGWGRAAFEPGMMVALSMYSYAQGERSSRGIERRCVEDVAYRVIAAQQTPDHATIVRFCVRHESALAGLFSEVQGLCRESGLLKVGVVAIDGTKVPLRAAARIANTRRGIYVASLRRPGVESPAASERREGLFDVEVDAEEQERPKDDGQQR